MLRASSAAHLPTKSDKVSKAERLDRKPNSSIKSSISAKPKRKQNKEVETSLLA